MIRSKMVLATLVMFGVMVLSGAHAEESMETSNEQLCQQEAMEAEGLVAAEVADYVAQCVEELQAEQDSEDSDSNSERGDSEIDSD